MSQDNQCLIPIPSVRRQFSDNNRNYSIICEVKDPENLSQASDLATGVFRMVRGDTPGNPNSFEVSKK